MTDSHCFCVLAHSAVRQSTSLTASDECTVLIISEIKGHEQFFHCYFGRCTVKNSKQVSKHFTVCHKRLVFRLREEEKHLVDVQQTHMKHEHEIHRAAFSTKDLLNDR